MSHWGVRSLGVSRSRPLKLVWASGIALLGVVCLLGLIGGPGVAATGAAHAISGDRVARPGAGGLARGIHAPAGAVRGGALSRLQGDTYVSAGTGSDVTGTGSIAAPFATIGRAISETDAGGTVHVARGTYTENLILEKALNLLGGYDAANWLTRSLEAYATTVDGRELGSVLSVDVQDGNGVTVEGFTFVNGRSDEGGGVRLASGVPVCLRSNWVVGNTAEEKGGGIYVDAASETVTLDGNTIFSNTAGNAGGGIHIVDGAVMAQNDVIANNRESESSGKGVYLAGGSLVARHWTLASNGTFGIWTRAGSARLTNTIVSSHTIGFDGGAIAADHSVFFNTPIPCNNGASCTHPVTGDPRFVEPANGNYHIGPGSAAFDAGVPAGVSTDVDGEPRPLCSGYDAGADELMPSRPVAAFASCGPDWLGEYTAFVNTTLVTGCADYVWHFGDDQTSHDVSPSHRYGAPGSYSVTLTATNFAGSSVATGTVVIYSPATGVAIDGPSTGRINTGHVFTATVEPITATRHITYVWQATGQAAAVHADRDISDSLAFTWDLAGPKIVTVTATNGGGTLSTSLPITLVAAGVPFSDGFESGGLSWPWNVGTTGEGRVAVTRTYGAHSGSYCAILDSRDGVSSTAGLVLNVDLSGQNGVLLDFWWRSFGDQSQAGDGVFIRDGGEAGWSKVFTFAAGYPPDGDYHHAVIHLDAEAAARDLSFGAGFQIMFQFEKNRSIPYDGYAVDAVRVTHIPVEGVDIDGPEVVNVGVPHSLTATVSPPTATLPISYTWWPAPTAGQGGRVATFTWPVTGPQTIRVTAENVGGSFTDTCAIHVVVPVGAVDIDGAETGTVDDSYAFTARVSPCTATLPITYRWQATGQDDVSTSTRALSHTVPYTWRTGGTKIITVTAGNVGGTRVFSHAISVLVPVGDVRMDGPDAVNNDTPGAFTAVVRPLSATVPITYRWQATGQADVSTRTRVLSHTMLFTWRTGGTKAVTVTAGNAGGTRVFSRTISVWVPVGDIGIEGPGIGITGTAHCFTATASPSTATLPITYRWQATGQEDVRVVTSALSCTVPFTWRMGGAKNVCVTAANAGGDSQACHKIILPPCECYIPVVMRSFWQPGQRWYAQGLGGQVVFALAGCDDGTVFAGAEDGVYRRAAGHTEWELERPTKGAVRGVAASPDCTRVYAAAIEDGILAREEGAWPVVSTEGMSQARAVALAENAVVAGGDFGVRYAPVDGGHDWSVPGACTDEPVTGLTRSDGRIYAATWGEGVWYCDQGGAGEWRAVNAGLDKLYVLSAMGAPTDGAPRFAGVLGGFYRWSGAEWMRPEPWGSSSTYCFAIDGVTAYAGQGSEGVLRSADEGVTWATLNDGWEASLPAVRALLIQADAAGRRWLYAGTSTGVWGHPLP